MNKQIITVELRESRVFTSVRMYHNEICYTEYGNNHIQTPLTMLNAESDNDASYWLKGCNVDTSHDWKELQFEGLKGTFILKAEIEKQSFNNKTTWHVKEARSIDRINGGKSVLSAFLTSYKESLLTSLCTAIAKKDVETLNKFLETVSKW